jgi:HEAT repeat protein
MPADPTQSVEQAINRLKSFHGGDAGVLDVVACGQRAIPALRALLFEREPSGLFQSRCRAVEALATLKAREVLIEYLEAKRVASDPVERLGDDAVINAAAQALSGAREERVFQLLLRLAQWPSRAGVIQALGAFGRREALPLLIDAIKDDASRRPAEAALKAMGRAACPALIAAAKSQAPSPEHESESSLRRRRSALAILQEIGVTERMWADLRCLVDGRDARVALLACRLCFMAAPAIEHSHALQRLARMLPGADWMLRNEIEDCLRSRIQQ